MKRKIISLLALLLLVTGCGEIPKLKNGKEAVVTFDNDKKISVDELYEKMKNTYALSTLVTLVDTYILEDAFPKYIDTAKEYAESQIAALRENYETEEELLEQLQYYTGLSSVEAYEESIYLSYMQSHAAEEYTKENITEKEINNYYKNEAVGDIEVSHILITPDVTDKMTEDEQKDAEDKALKKANEILKTLKDTDKKELETKFVELAKESSEDEATKKDGGSLGRINKTTLGDSYDELVKAAYSIKDGSIYGKVITSELGYHVILKTKSHEKDTLEKLKDKIIETLSKEKLAEDTTIPTKALQHYRNNSGMEIIDSELKTQYAYYIQNSLMKTTEK